MKHTLHERNFYEGVVEDRMDPDKLGRVRVRFFGVHTPNKDLIPTEDLPWATVLFPNKPSDSITPLKEGTWVVGYFSDENYQYPVVLGLIPGKVDEEYPSKFGFVDPSENLSDRPKRITSRTITEDGSPSSFSETNAESNSLKDKSDVNGYLKGDGGEIIDHRNQTALKELPTAGLDVGEDGEETWDELTTLYGAAYPWNDATLYESGHLIEFDNTPGAERIHEFHRSGTFREIFPNGDRVQKIVNNDHHFVHQDKRGVIFGAEYTYTLGPTNDLNVDNVIVHDKNNRTHTTDVDVTRNIGGNSLTKITGNDVDLVDGNIGKQSPTITLAGNVHLGADSINEDGSPNAPSEEPVVLGDKLVTFLESLIDWIDQHAHPTPAGPSGPPVLQKGLSAINTVPPKPQLKQLLSEIVKTQ